MSRRAHSSILKDPSPTSSPEREEELSLLQREKKVRRRRSYFGGSVRSVVKTAAYLTLVLLLGVLLAFVIIFAANDVFALNDNLQARRYREGYRTDDPTVSVEVELPEYAGVEDIAEILHKSGLVRYPTLFRVYAALRHKSGADFQAGSYTLNNTMDYDTLLSAFVPSRGKREQIAITIPEGYCVDDIIDLLVERGIGSKEGFARAINEESYDYWFLEDLPPMAEDDARFYRLEGYLYPDTYYFYSDSSEKEAVVKMLDNFGNKFRRRYVERCEELGFSVDQVITLASLVQAEGRFESDYTGISSVFHNRLVSESLNHTLQSDATIQYYFRHTEGSKHDPVTVEDNQIVTPYNSYLNSGLPVGPITNPTISAISAAMYPIETDYYYFVTDTEGNCLFAKTYEGHQQNIERVRREKEAAAAAGEQ